MKYRIKKIMKYTEYVEVEANSDAEAKEIAMCVDGDRYSDDWLDDMVIVSKEDIS